MQLRSKYGWQCWASESTIVHSSIFRDGDSELESSSTWWWMTTMGWNFPQLSFIQRNPLVSMFDCHVALPHHAHLHAFHISCQCKPWDWYVAMSHCSDRSRHLSLKMATKNGVEGQLHPLWSTRVFEISLYDHVNGFERLLWIPCMFLNYISTYPRSACHWSTYQSHHKHIRFHSMKWKYIASVVVWSI